MPVKKEKKKDVKPVVKESPAKSKSQTLDLHELTIRVENAEAKVEECYVKMNKALAQLLSLTTMLPKIKKCCDRLGI
tara:strand:- start:8208 stop:8438 length:231 start_codon:yes stop_codon:yes gene_type:complete